MIDSEKSKEKAKRGDSQDGFSASVAMRLLVLSSLFLTVMTSHKSIGLLPNPAFFYFGGIAIAMFALSLPAVIFLTRGLKNSDMIVMLVIITSLAVIRIPMTPIIAFIGGFFFKKLVYEPLSNMPVLIFPILFLVSLILSRFSRQVSEQVPLSALRIASCFLALFAAFYVWGQASNFEGKDYDESLVVEGKSYHSILHDGYFSESDILYLYQCQMGYFFCTKIDSIPHPYYEIDRSSLSYDEASNVLQLQDGSSIIYEYPLP